MLLPHGRAIPIAAPGYLVTTLLPQGRTRLKLRVMPVVAVVLFPGRGIEGGIVLRPGLTAMMFPGRAVVAAPVMTVIPPRPGVARGVVAVVAGRIELRRREPGCREPGRRGGCGADQRHAGE